MEKLRELKSKQGKGSGGMDQMILFNDLVYKQPRQGSLISQRHAEKFNAQNQSYFNTSSSMDYIFQTGEQLLDARNSYIQFKLQVDVGSATSWNFGNGSAANLFQSAILHSRQGDEVDRLSDLNIYQVNKDLYKPQDYYGGVASVQGYNVVNYPVGSPAFFQVPLCNLLNIFDTPQLVPPQLISGARLQLNIEKDPLKVFQFEQTPTGSPTWTFTDVRIVCMLSRPTDATSSQLDKNSASNGLEFSWKSVHTQRHSETTRLDQSVSKAVARALRLMVVPVITGNAEDLKITPEGVSYDNLQCRAGSSYFPQYRLEQGEIYYHGLTNADHGKGGIRYNKIEADAKANTAVVSLESHNLIQYSGTALNNSRQLFVESDFTDGNGARTVYLFLEYMKTARVYLNSVAIDS
jgi:hypothetical protein